MNRISELMGIIGKQLDWHKSRVDCFARILIALFRVRTVNLRELSVGMDSTSTIDSRNKRIYRFIAHFKFDLLVISNWLFHLFFSDDKKFYVAIDRTNWKWGRKPINIFMLSICFEGIAIPIIWQVLPKGETTSAEEQISLCERFVQRFGKDRIEGLLADREFANRALTQWLRRNEIAFYIRIKGNTQVRIKGKKYKPAYKLFPSIKPYESQTFGMAVELFGAKYFLTASKNEQDELMIILTNANYKSAIPCYLRRWEIESLFQSLKGRGFRFEDTHVTEPERIEKIIAILAVGVAWAHKTGEWRAEIKSIPMKIIKNQRRPQYSYFRYGFDWIRDLITGFHCKPKPFRRLLAHLEIPPSRAIS